MPDCCSRWILPAPDKNLGRMARPCAATSFSLGRREGVGIPCVLVSHVGRRSLIQKAPATGILAWVLLSWLRRGERFCSIGVLVLPRGLHTILLLNLLPHFMLVSVLSPLRCPSS